MLGPRFIPESLFYTQSVMFSPCFIPESMFYCWRALARQLPILYNREKKAKSVVCKIGDLRSKFAFNIRGLLNVETCAVDYGCL